MTSVREVKANIRKSCRDLIDQSDLQPHDAAKKICRILIQDPNFDRAQSVALYYSRPDEIPTQHIHDACLSQGKRICYPRMNPDHMHLEFYSVHNLAEMERGPFGIMEPKMTAPSEHQIDLFIVPGVAFSTQGARLGRGFGFFDRTFVQSQFQNSKRYGVAYSCQIRSDIPMEETDVAVHKVFTPEQVYACGGQ